MPVLLVYPDQAMEIYSFQGTGDITRATSAQAMPVPERLSEQAFTDTSIAIKQEKKFSVLHKQKLINPGRVNLPDLRGDGI